KAHNTATQAAEGHHDDHRDPVAVGGSVMLSRPPALPARPAVTAPLSPDRYKYQVTISGETVEKIRLAKEMLGHAIPTGDDAAVLDRAVTALLAELAKKKFAGTEGARPPRGGQAATAAATALRTPATRTLRASVKRAVWMRDLGRCAFIGTGGHLCDETR